MKKLSRKQANERLKELRKLINTYRYHYHVLNESLMSEAAADSLKHELTDLESQFPDLITPDSPSQKVAGGILPGFTQVQHKTRMLSLNDVFNQTEIESWIKRLQKLMPNMNWEFFIDIKMDGLACALTYQDGIFTKAVTRGNGFVGEDVTANVRTIENIPLGLIENSDFNYFRQGRTEIR